ncbi:ABC transporter ATP-binding protein [Candidatus Aerophobetes bacterium]|nr:ABC transporter ATP-binding protein [Candidatus Aerophobetes bacterium]
MVPVLKGIDVEINRGEFVIIFGPSGCGKSTLLHTLLGLEPPTDGQVLMEGKNFYTLSDDERSFYRKQKVGTIYQQPLWIKSLDVINNVAFPLRLLGKEEEALRRAFSCLKGVGMEKWAHYLPTELSAGQQQKVSLARALVVDPILIAADEPTGNLDTVSGQELMDGFLSLNQEGKTILMITHDLEYLKYASEIFHMVDGRIVEMVKNRKRGKLKINGKKKKEDEAVAVANVRDPQFLKKLMSA